jgi:hypothetical protein
VLSIISHHDRSSWTDIVRSSRQHDVYHLCEYHDLSTALSDSDTILIHFESDSGWIALPLIIRPIHKLSDSASIPTGLYDATSVYGYSGPITSHDPLPPEDIARFHASLKMYLQSRSVVSVFSRLHPLIRQSDVITGIGDVVTIGRTVSINVRRTLEEQWDSYRRDHKRDINRLKRDGLRVVHDTRLDYLGEFVDIYHETMDRVSANSSYYFDHAYFRTLFSSMPGVARLFIALLDSAPIAGAIFLTCDGIMQTHLSGHRSTLGRFSPKKLIIDEARVWASQNGLHTFHLGGGVGSQEDSVYRFKAGFADQEHCFQVWRWIVEPETYAKLVDLKLASLADPETSTLDKGYFPLYRAPAVRRAEPRSD